MDMDMDMDMHYDHGEKEQKQPKQKKKRKRNKIKSSLIMITSSSIKENAKNAADLIYQRLLHPVNTGCFCYYAFLYRHGRNTAKRVQVSGLFSPKIRSSNHDT